MPPLNLPPSPSASVATSSPRFSTKIAIPRLKIDAGPAFAPSESGHAPRVTQACGPCKQRKSKCSGHKPVCKHCQQVKIPCYYTDGKQQRVKKCDIFHSSPYQAILLLTSLEEIWKICLLRSKTTKSCFRV